jgi:ankyrin repeat protein
LEVLRPCLSKNLPRTLEELPKSLDETYRRILKEINNANRQDAHRLLQCLTVARRPLRVEELAEVLALDVDAGGVPRVNEKWRWEDHEGAVLSACSSLVSVINLDGSRVVQFSHFSVQEFLTSDRLASIEDVSLFHIADEASHAILAQACLAVLLCLNDRTSEYSVWKIPLSEYVSEHWVDHTRVGKVDLQIKGGLDYFFDLDNPHFAAYIRIWGLYHLVTVSSDDEQIAVLPPAAPLCLAAHLGLSGLAERLIAKRPDLIDFCGQEGTPLHLSVQQGHMEVVQLLLARGADINVSSPNNITPLHIALREEHLEIGKFLLDCGADVNTQDKNGRTPLRLTAARGYFDVFQILLERKANMHVPDNNGMTPLHLAVYHGHLEITRLLLDHNVDVNYRDNNGSSPFLNAMSSGNLEIVQLLLDNKADAHVHDNSGNTPLHFAAFGGHLEVARLLLELNADVHSVNDNGSTPLHRATESERKEGIPDLVRLLVDNGADVHTHDNSGDTPLHFSAFRGHVEVTRMLLELNADANSLNNRGSTPLLRATQNRRQEGTSDIV